MGTMHTLGLVVITEICQNDCVFCDLGKKNKLAKHRPFDDLKAQIDQIAASGTRQIALTGGEPTLHPQLLDVIRYCRDHDFNYIRLYSHGRQLATRNLAKKLEDVGLTHIMISLFGPDAESHNNAAVATSFDETLSGIRAASDTNLKIVINTPVTIYNHNKLAKYVDLLAQITHQETIWQLSDLFPTTAVLKTPEVHPRYEVVAGYLNEALTKAASQGREVLLQEFPLCVTFPWHDRAKELGHWGKTLMLVGEKELPRDIIPSRPWTAPDRIFYPECGQCLLRSKCLGTSSSYSQQHPDSQFVKPF